jgi:hypothetical protein
MKSLKSEPGSNPKAIPGFSVNVILKKSFITGIDSPRYIPSNFKLKAGREIPLM